MPSFSRISWLSWGLGAATLVILLAQVPDPATFDVTAWLFFAGLVAFMLNLGTMLSEGVVSPAATGALLAYLALGEAANGAAALWCVAVGTLTGNVVWLMRSSLAVHSRRDYARVLRSIVLSTAQLTLGVGVGGWAYGLFDGRLPLDQLDETDILPLLVLVGMFISTYLSLLFAEAYLVRRQMPRQVMQNWAGGVQIVLLPLPLAVVGAVAYHDLSQLAFVILIGGLLTMATGASLINHTQARYRQQVVELSSLSAISQAMRTNQDLNALLEVVYEQVALLLGVRNFVVALHDASRHVLYFPSNIQAGQPVPLAPREAANGLLEYVIERGEALLLPDHVARRCAELGRTPPDGAPGAWLGVPLLTADRVLGCMAVFTTQPGRRLTTKDLELLTTIAAQTGIATDNSQLYGQARDRSVQLATLNNVATILGGSLEMERVLDLVGSSAVAVANCHAVALYMWWRGVEHGLSLSRHSGLSEAFGRAPVYPLLVDLDDLDRRRQPLLVTDSHHDQRARRVLADLNREGKRAWAEFLLRKGDDLLGILVFFYNEPRHFAHEETELLRNFTNLAALAINNARLYTRTDAALNRRVEQLSALADINRELTSTLNLPGLFQVVLTRALEATESSIGMLLMRMDEEQFAPRLVAYRGIEPALLEQAEPLAGYVEQTYRTGYPTVIGDMVHEGSLSLLSQGIRAQLNVPVLRGDDVLGVISLGSRQPNDYTSDDLAFVTQLATQARIAIDNARLFRRIEIARDRLQVILDSMKEAVILVEGDGRITLANPRVWLLLGLDPRGLLDQSVVELLQDRHLRLAERLGFGVEALLGVIHNLARGQWDGSTRDSGRITFEVTTPHQRFIDRTDAPVRDERGRVIGLLMVFFDVTQERELVQAREDLSSMIVHDLRGPLTAVTTSLKLLNEFAPGDDPLGQAVRQTTEMSSRAVRKLLNLVDSLLDISKLESGVMALDYEPTDLAALCTGVLEELHPLADELAVDLRVEVPDDAPLLNADAEKLERVILNLVDNAVKFTPAGGAVVVRSHAPGAGGAVAGFMRIDVIDDGPGIPDAHKARLFDRFAQVEGRQGRRRGTGLGLTFCKLAVEAHGGRIWIEDNPHGGAIFALTLPVVDIAALELNDDLDE